MMTKLTELAVALCVNCALAAAGEQPQFEAASVKRLECGMIHNSLGPATVILKGDPLRVILTEAFELKTYQIVGPSWLDEDCFELVAKAPGGAAIAQIPAMLQALLVERFKLAAHKEDRPRPVYALVVDKGGPKFKEANLNFRRMGPRPGQVMFRAASDVHGFQGDLTMATVAHFLSGWLDRPVQDFTGLTGKYEIDLSWMPDPTIDRQPAWASYETTQAAVGISLPDAPRATLFTAVRDSLGLRLESRTEPVEMLVIDHVERVPTGN
jgi:uncharacterized protein (TIGR03435 family)